MPPRAYFLTWRCYGTWLHGEGVSFDRNHNRFGDPGIPRSDLLADYERMLMKHPQAMLAARDRQTVSRSIYETAEAKGWHVEAANVRSNHVHVVIGAEARSEVVLRTLKAWATRYLRDSTRWPPGRPVWSAGGSTRYLWTERDVAGAVEYVNDMQDVPRERSK